MAAPERPTPRLPRGFRDVFGDALVQRQRMIERIVAVYRRYGFTALETPIVEYLETLGKYLPDTDRPEGGVFAFRDERDEWLALRYDLTAPLSRVMAQYPDLPLPFRRYQVGSVFRDEKPGPGRFCEFIQCDFDTVGTASMLADAEVCSVLGDVMEALGFQPGDYRIRVNNRKVLNGVLEKAGLNVADSREDVAGPWLTVLRAIDKLDRVGLDGVAQLLGKGRMDESGDFTKGAALATGQIDTILGYLQLVGQERGALVTALGALTAGSKVGEEGVAELAEIDRLLTAAGAGDERITFDPTVVRGLAYYTGPVYEAELTFEVKDEKGEVTRFGSVAGGGRYDDLVDRFLGKVVPATGASMGVDRLLAALELARPEAGGGPDSVLVVVMDPNFMAEYMGLAAELRAAGVAAELYMGEGRVGAQLRYADRRGLPAVVICGENEFASNEVSVKDLAVGRKLAQGMSDRKQWQEERPAQVTIPRGELVATVRRIIDGE
ncbi:MAG: histidine--tRNA ligase [Candidatus Latescibacteria bacterium]|nr:histidine--tRNA ligase [Candidatus Latescibacterota bacterium]MCB9516718.1 histidine--tRNA ligase [Candidatus Latescibacterota bacterium]